MKWLTAFILITVLLSVAPVASAAPSKPVPTQTPAKPKLPACRPDERESWPIVDENTVIEGRTIVVRQSPDGRKRCGTMKQSTRRPSQTAPKKVRK